MEKLLSLFCTLYFVLCTSVVAFAYTSADVSNAQFLADENLIVKQSAAAGYRLDDSITRAEVIGIALKMKWVQLPEKYTCNNYFTDVKYDAKNNWICRAVELAADYGLITKANAKFRPNDKITRIEALAILAKAKDVKNLVTSEQISEPQSMYNSYKADLEKLWLTDWQKKLIHSVKCDIFSGFGQCSHQSFDLDSVERFWANTYANRSDVIKFAFNFTIDTAHSMAWIKYFQKKYALQFSLPDSFYFSEYGAGMGSEQLIFASTRLEQKYTYPLLIWVTVDMSFDEWFEWYGNKDDSVVETITTNSGLVGHKVTRIWNDGDYADYDYLIEISSGKIMHISIRAKDPEYDLTDLLPEVEKIVNSVQLSPTTNN